ncbi:MAG TPA: HAMP domain-containing sensor histidine kinase [Bacillales bacterium]|nr:HAMP domain-containing sensor histidine kinase [Bacillales bacterium]
MDTKWKSRLTAIGWLLLFTFGISGVFTLLSDLGRFTQSYYETSRFHYQVDEYVSDLSKYELDPLTKEEAKSALTVNEDEVFDYRVDHGDPNVAQEQSKQKKEAIRKKILANKVRRVDEYFQRREQDRSQFVNRKSSFLYYLKDNQTGEIYTDMNMEKGQSLKEFLSNHDMSFVQRYPSSNTGFLTKERPDYPGIIAQLPMSESTYSGMIAVPDPLPANSVINRRYSDFHQQQIFYWIFSLAGILALAASLFMLKRIPVFQFVEIRRWQPYYNRMPVDVCLGALLFIGGIAYTSMSVGFTYFYYNLLQIMEDLVISAGLTAFTIIQVKFLYERLKNRDDLQREWEYSLLNRLLSGIRDAFMSSGTGMRMVMFLGVILATGFGIPVVMWEPAAIIIYVPLFIVITLPVLLIIFKRVGYFNRIVHNTTRLALGNAEPDLPVKGKSPLAELAGNVNTLKHGVESSQAEQAKSERFKTELITNVSHDLRTPLTSIITYTELLKTPELANEDRAAYIEIIDRKSKRLKVLIEDLFEASKMASGSIELVKEKVDINQLLQQALAENNEMIDESSLQFRVSKPESPVYCIVDGQKLWRVFDNLIGNILKYSLEHTRVFVSVKTERDRAVMTFKNITKYELSENIDELFERFKRGDTSRHTDGSGLGLAIAKSIVDLHGGMLDIEVDGDLFKVTVTLPALQ